MTQQISFSDTWNIDDLASKIGISPENLRKKMIFWMNNGVVKEINKQTFQLMVPQEQMEQRKKKKILGPIN